MEFLNEEIPNKIPIEFKPNLVSKNKFIHK